MVLGQVEPARIDLDAIEERLARPEYARVVDSLREVGFTSLNGLLGTYAGQKSDLEPWLEGAEINRDGNLRLQYLAGLALNTSMEGTIYDQLLAFRRWPQNVFAGSDARLRNLMYGMQAGGN